MSKTINLLNRSHASIMMRHGDIIRDLDAKKYLQENELFNEGLGKYPNYMERIKPMHLRKTDSMILRLFNDYAFMWVYNKDPRLNLEIDIDDWFLNCEKSGKPPWIHSNEKSVHKFFVKLRCEATRKLGNLNRCIAYKPQNCAYIDFVYPYIFNELKIFRRKI